MVSRINFAGSRSCINESANARGEAVCVLGALPLPR
ncbi:SocE, partial [Salmonella enterica subsp. enterica serovar Typhimurium]